jgi:acyl-CoA thioesterase YciA
MAFQQPVKIGDTLSIYTHISRVGTTSITLVIEAWAQRFRYEKMEKVTEGTFIMVALDGDGKPKAVPPES